MRADVRGVRKADWLEDRLPGTNLPRRYTGRQMIVRKHFNIVPTIGMSSLRTYTYEDTSAQAHEVLHTLKEIWTCFRSRFTGRPKWAQNTMRGYRDLTMNITVVS